MSTYIYIVVGFFGVWMGTLVSCHVGDMLITSIGVGWACWGPRANPFLPRPLARILGAYGVFVGFQMGTFVACWLGFLVNWWSGEPKLLEVGALLIVGWVCWLFVT